MDESQVDISTVMCRQIRVLAALIGLPETLKLLDARGGQQLKIPLSAENAVVLKDILSTESIEKLCEAMGGKKIDVPKKDKVTDGIRNHAIRSLRSQKTAPALAVEFDLTRRMIIYICADLKQDNKQVDLFE